MQLPSRREPVVAENGGEIVIKAPYSAHPPPKVKWMKNGNEIQQGKEESTIKCLFFFFLEIYFIYMNGSFLQVTQIVTVWVLSAKLMS